MFCLSFKVKTTEVLILSTVVTLTTCQTQSLHSVHLLLLAHAHATLQNYIF